MFGLAFSNSATSSRNFLWSTASVVGGRPLTVMVTGPSLLAAGVGEAEEQAAEARPSAATTSSPAARPNGDRFIRQHLPWSTASTVWCADHTNAPPIDARTQLRLEITNAGREEGGVGRQHSDARRKHARWEGSGRGFGGGRGGAADHELWFEEELVGEHVAAGDLADQEVDRGLAHRFDGLADGGER